MTTRKRTKRVIRFLVVLFVVVAGVWAYTNIKDSRRQALLTHLVKNLQTYKTANGRFPPDLSNTIAREEHWIDYVVDSMGQSFMLSYNGGIMDHSIFRYFSQTREWEEGF